MKFEKHLICFGFQIVLIISSVGQTSAQSLVDSFRKIDTKPVFPYGDGWLGGDGALSVQLSDQKVLWIFSDSYVSGNPDATTRIEASAMVANTIAINFIDNKQVDMHYFWKNSGGEQSPYFESPSQEYKFWPVWAFYNNDSVFVFMVKVGEKENPDPDDIFNFTLKGTSLAVVTNINAANPLEWQIDLIPYTDIYPGESWTQAGTDENYLYVIKNFNRENFLTRVPLSSLVSPWGAVEYWTIGKDWNKGSSGSDRKVLFVEQANGSLEFYPNLNRWLYVYGPNFLSNEIKYRYSDQITGPWSDSKVLYITPEQTLNSPSYDPRHFCYLARSHITFYDASLRKLLITYDCNSTEFSHAFASDSIYVPRVLSIHVPTEIK
jgi:hypothetical protein